MNKVILLTSLMVVNSSGLLFVGGAEAREVLKPEIVNANNKYVFIPLHTAVYIGDQEVVAQLLKDGADVNAKKDDGFTPLHAAALLGSQEIVAQLLQAGADVNAENNVGYTPLRYAEKNNDCQEVVKLLKAAGARG